jgi:two-component system sensor kinase FixL
MTSITGNGNRGNWPGALLARRYTPGFLLPALVVAGATAIFAVDLALRWDIASDVLYVVVILLAAPHLSRRGILIIAIGCVVLTVIGLLPDRDLGLSVTRTAQRLIVIVAIGITTLLAVRSQQAAAAVRARTSRLDPTAPVLDAD